MSRSVVGVDAWGDAFIVGTDDGVVWCFDKDSLQYLWHIKTDERLSAGPVSSGNGIFVGTESGKILGFLKE